VTDQMPGLPEANGPGIVAPCVRATLAPTIAIGMFFFVNGAAYASWVSRLADIKAALAISDTQLGLALMGSAVGSLLVNFVFIRLVERLGSRWATQLSSVGLAVLLPLVAIAPTAPALFAALATLGMLDVLADAAANTQGMQIQRLRGTSIITRLHGTWSIGALAGGLVAGRAVAADISVRTQLIGTAVVLLAMAVTSGRWLIAHDRVDDEIANGGDEPVARHRAIGGPGRAAAAVFIVAGAAGLMAEVPATEWSTLMVAERFPRSSVGATVGFTGFAIGMVVGRFIGDRVADRFGSTCTRRVGAAANLIGFVVACTVPNLAIVVLALAVAGIGCSWINPLLVQRAIEVFGGPRGAVLVGTGARFGILLGTPLMGRVSDLANRSVALLIIGGGAAALLTVLRLPNDDASASASASAGDT
jgi:predicted MFS family arabinose efflux permease